MILKPIDLDSDDDDCMVVEDDEDVENLESDDDCFITTSSFSSNAQNQEIPPLVEILDSSDEEDVEILDSEDEEEVENEADEEIIISADESEFGMAQNPPRNPNHSSDCILID